MSKYDRDKSKLRKYIEENKGRLIYFVLISLIIIVVIPLIFIVTGLDQSIIKNSIQGYVYDIEGNRLEGASITIQDISATTDSSGHYLLEGIVYGIYEVKVEKNGYGYFEEDVQIRRFENNRDFTLESLEFGEIAFTFDYNRELGFNRNEFEIKINDELLILEDNLTVNSGKLLTGNYALTITSPFYKDIEEKLEIEPGTYKKEIILQDAVDIVAEVKDWLNGNLLTPNKVEIKTESAFEELSADDINGNRIEIKDLDLFDEITIKVSKEGYNSFLKEVKLQPGRNSLNILNIVPEGTIAYIDSTSSNSIIKVSQYNGSNANTVLNVTDSCNNLSINASFGAALCGSTYHIFSLDAENPSIISSLSISGEQVNFEIGHASAFVIDNSSPDRLVRISSNETTSLYSGDEEVVSVGVSENGEVIFTTSGKVMSVQLDGSDLKEIASGIFTVADVSFDGATTLLYNFTGQNTSNIWLLDNKTGDKRKLSFLPSGHSNVTYTSNDEMVFIKGGNLYKQAIDSTSPTLLKSKIVSAQLIEGTNILLVKKNTNTFLLSLISNKLSKVII